MSYQFKDYLEQSHTFNGIVIGYALGTDLNISSICYGDSFAIGNDDKSTESDKVDRDFVMDMKSLIDWVEGTIKKIEGWKLMHYTNISEDDPIFRVEIIDKKKIH